MMSRRPTPATPPVAPMLAPVKLTMADVVAAAPAVLDAVWSSDPYGGGGGGDRFCLVCMLIRGRPYAGGGGGGGGGAAEPHSVLLCPLFERSKSDLCDRCRREECTKPRCDLFSTLKAAHPDVVKFCWLCCRPWAQQMIALGKNASAALVCGPRDGKAGCAGAVPAPRPILFALARVIADSAGQGVGTGGGALGVEVARTFVRLFSAWLPAASSPTSSPTEVVADLAWQREWLLVQLWPLGRGLCGLTALLIVAHLVARTMVSS